MAAEVDELKPCPFCGGKRLQILKAPRFRLMQNEPESWGYSVRCSSCGASGGWAKGPGFSGEGSEEERKEMGRVGARRWWNMRV